ncbi:hypothetical protein QJS10_CPA08g00190 [Acorus calamus]|uniref:Zeta toxin domain-containing protein n=1 Tax=Acorus calamus TaxID=4465 RepID=A0AAV9EAM3_ACOCL|nr:hypothetical protein QJS10_CPA08g00190 [Acorus calamus]
MEKYASRGLLFLRFFALSATGLAALAMHLHQHRRKRPPPPPSTVVDQKVVPHLVFSGSGHIEKLESFSEYVARQIGFDDKNECPHICKLANNYLRKSKESEDDVFAFIAGDPDAESLYPKLIEEFDRCILAYFSFHWKHTSLMISQVLSVESEPKKKLKRIFLDATRKQRFERVTKNLKVTRVFSTLVEEMKAIGIAPSPCSADDSKCTEVMVPAAHSERSPVLLLMGGGMGAGKSTVLKDILSEPFWVEAGANAVVVEADAFKETDVIYRALSSRGHHHDMLQTAELVHQSSTDAASSLLVTALNEGRDVIMDGTLSWEPFVEQTIAMVRSVHRRRYRMGLGYVVSDTDGSVTEDYWEPIHDETGEQNSIRKPYRIELVGVVCDAYLAVVRGIRRAILMGRAVRVHSQLKSHKRFASAFDRYCPLVDNARVYSTNAMGSPPKMIAWKAGDNNLLVDPSEIGCLGRVGSLNEEADSVYELYKESEAVCGSGSLWNDAVLSPSRSQVQKDMKIAIQRIESHASS